MKNDTYYVRPHTHERIFAPPLKQWFVSKRAKRGGSRTVCEAASKSAARLIAKALNEFEERRRMNPQEYLP